MRVGYLLSILLLLSLGLQAQVNVGEVNTKTGERSSIKENDMQALKRSTVNFVCGDADIEMMEQMLSEFWTFTDYKVITYYEYQDMNIHPNGDAFFTIEPVNNVKDADPGFQNTHFCYRLWLPSPSGREKQIELARLALYTRYSVYEQLMHSGMKKTKEDLYYTSSFFNWTPGILASQLKRLHKHLATQRELWLRKEINHPALKELEKDTLIIPKQALIKLNLFTGSENEFAEAEDVLKKYKYPYQIVSDADFNKMLENEQDMHYLLYVRSGLMKIVNIIRHPTGKLLYQRYDSKNYKLKRRDFKEISKSI